MKISALIVAPRHTTAPGASVRRLASLVAAFLLVVASWAAAQEVPQLTVGHLTEGPPPSIDGRVDEEVWSKAPPFSAFIQQEPNEGQPATERTEIRFLIDRRNLYIAVVCYDSSPGQIVVSESRRDANLTDTDSIQILLDTFNDGQNAFLFGTNPFGIEYDGQVMGEGQTAGNTFVPSGSAGSQRGQVRGFNANWDADWTVRAHINERGWEAELAIPLKTLRYSPGADRTWGINVMRNIRHKNEQVFLALVPRGYTLHRVSVAGKLNGLDLPDRRDLKLMPYVAGSVNDDKTLLTNDTVDFNRDVGLDVKWGVRADLTLDVTLNTDFAQVEADEEQVNLTRFQLFFPEKRPFFLENAQTFQLGQPQSIDLFFSRRIGLSQGGQPIDILAGGRLSGKLGGYNVGFLSMQTASAVNRRTGETIAPSNNYSVVRMQREVGRSNFGAMLVNRQGVGDLATADDFNRAYAVDLAWQATTNGKLFAFLARTDSPTAKGGSDYAGRAYYSYANPVLSGGFGYSQVGDQFNPEVGFLPRRAYRRAEARYALSYQPKRWPWIRRFQSTLGSNTYVDLGNRLESSNAHLHVFEILPQRGGRLSYVMDLQQDRPREGFKVYEDVTGRAVFIPAGEYAWVSNAFEFESDPSAPINMSLRTKTGTFYDGDHHGWEASLGVRMGARLITSVGWNRDDITLPGGSFTNDLLPMSISYSFTSLASVQGLIQYNSQTSTVSSNIRLAMLNRSGTGLFLVYNDRRETNDLTARELLGRSFIAKYTRFLDF